MVDRSVRCSAACVLDLLVHRSGLCWRGTAHTVLNLAESPQSILCAVKKTETEEIGLVWPLLAQIAIGTLLWIASLVAAITVRGTHCLCVCS